MRNIETDEIARIVEQVKGHVQEHLRGLAAEDVVALDRVEAMARELAQRVGGVVFEAWTARLEEVAVTAGGTCTGCGGARKVKRRAGAPMTVSVLGLMVSVPKLYLECDCGQAGVSITRLLTGLSSGDKSGELELMAAYCGAEHSYGKASRDLSRGPPRPARRAHGRTSHRVGGRARGRRVRAE